MRIFDCFIAVAERDMIACRQAELAGRDATHVAVESDTDHRGQPKACYLTRDPMPGVDAHCVEVNGTRSTWEHERTQRDLIIEVLAEYHHPAPDDLVIAGDVDEIVRGSAVDRIAAATVYQPHKLGMRLHIWSARWAFAGEWTSAVAFRWHHRPRSVTDLRGTRPQLETPVVDGAGWHLSWFGDSATRHWKLSHFTHNELDTPAHHARLDQLDGEGVDINGYRLRAWDGSDLPKGCPQ